MQIISVALKDLRSYESAYVEFAPGVNAIVGNNGAGKSTVLSAIGLALFNTRPPNNRNDDLIRDGAKTAEIVVEFESAYDQRRYQVSRRFGGSNHYRVHDPELGQQLLADGVTDCEDWLRQHLGVSREMSLSDLFENTVGVFQGAFTAPFLMTPAARKPIFDPLLRVDEYLRASQALLRPYNALKEQDQAAQVRLANIGGQLLALPDLQRQLDAAQARLAAAKQALAHTSTALGEAQQRCAAHDDLRTALSAAEQARERLAAEMGAQQATLTAAQEALDQAQEAARLTLAAARGHERYLQADQERNSLEQEQQQRDKLLAQSAQLQTGLATSNAQAQGLRQQLSALEATAQQAALLEPQAVQQTELTTALSVAKQAAQEWQQLRRQLAELEARLTRQQAQVTQLTAEVAEREQLIAAQSAGQAIIEQLQQASERRQLQRGQCQAAQTQLTKQLADLRDAAGGVCPLCEGPLNDVHRAEIEQRNQHELQGLETQLAALDLEQIQAEQQRKTLQRQLQEGNRRLAALSGSTHLEAATREWAALQEKLAQTSAQVDALGAPEAEVARWESELAVLGNPAQALAISLAALAQRPRLEAELAQTLVQQQTVADSIAALDGELALYARLDERLAAVRAAQQEHLDDHNSYLTHQHEAAQVGVRQERVTTLEAARAALQTRLTQAEGAAVAARTAYDPAADQQAQQERLRLSNEVASHEATLKADQDTLIYLRGRVAELEGLRAEQQALQVECARIAQAMGLISWARDLLKSAGPLVTRQLVQRISYEAAELYSTLMDNYAVHLNWSETYDLTLEVNGVDRGYAQLSGGEQMCAALALRLALLRKLTGIDIAFFDEPTAHLDSERRSMLAHTLTQVRGFGQIFVISHDSTFEQAAQAYYVVTKDGDGSHIERL